MNSSLKKVSHIKLQRKIILNCFLLSKTFSSYFYKCKKKIEKKLSARDLTSAFEKDVSTFFAKRHDALESLQ